MATPIVQVNRLNQMQGAFDEVERYLCFIGLGGTNKGTLQTVNTDTDLDDVLGAETSLLKTQVQAAKSNAGQNWNACVFVLDGVLTWSEAVDYVMEQTSVEGFVIVDPIAASTDLEAMQTKQGDIMAQYMRPTLFIAAGRQLAPATDTWSAYVAELSALTDGIRADAVSIVPYMWGHELGTYAGRLCDRSVTVADSPMRVATGTLAGTWSDKPLDKDGRAIDRSILKALESVRFSVPWWYPDYEGMYWTDGNLLDVSGGDYQVIENLRVVQKVMRRIYPLAVSRIADRRLNSTPTSIAENQTYFMRPLREMSKSVQILGNTFPGEVKPPQDGDIVISWPSKYAVEIYSVIRPYNCPKSITCNLMLDLANA
ncbi:MAG: DUF2586 domain-containing protein [Desulfovibrio sp.]|uniref:DUF2586 domain-containing protein n=1 Tax=Desulfovibrio sp. 7SRBS1 TaxID=3378064 RepID=UPI003B3F9360